MYKYHILFAKKKKICILLFFCLHSLQKKSFHNSNQRHSITSKLYSHAKAKTKFFNISAKNSLSENEKNASDKNTTEISYEKFPCIATPRFGTAIL